VNNAPSEKDPLDDKISDVLENIDGIVNVKPY
jgi:hypothetical protein